MEERWFIKNKKADFEALSRQFGVSRILARLIVNRNVADSRSFSQYLADGGGLPGDPLLMKDMERARDILIKKIREGKRIRIIGDYDADGIMSVYILKTALERCKAAADYCIPDRIRDGYGLNPSLVEAAEREGIDTLLTCDNGISATEAVARAKQLGMTVLVTDHHDIPYEDRSGERHFLIPPADAVVDPKQEDCPYPFSGICGAVVALRLAQALYAVLLPEEDALDEFAEFAAIATVCDVMELSGENRLLVKRGLAAIRDTKNIGLRALLRETGLTLVGAYHLGFVIGPCINATGRLETADLALGLLFAKKEEEAARLAARLRELNQERKAMTEEGVKRAVDLIETGSLLRDRVLVLGLADCHESLAGIIAGRLRERYFRPVFVFTETESGWKGSGRSIEAYPMYERLCECRELLLAFGGHPMAAGLSLKKENLEPLRKKLNERSGLRSEDLISKVTFDMELPLSEATLELTRELSLLEPYGKGNAKPLFAQRRVRLVKGSVMGAGRRVIRLSLALEGENRIYPGILFQDASVFEAYLEERYGKGAPESLYLGKKEGFLMDILYYPDINEYRGNQSLQLVIAHYR